MCQCVKITNLKVPATFELDNDSSGSTGDGSSGDDDDLILDCEYEISEKETGFVLKWLFNEQSIYQWIPSHKPYALVMTRVSDRTRCRIQFGNCSAASVFIYIIVLRPAPEMGCMQTHTHFHAELCGAGRTELWKYAIS